MGAPRAIDDLRCKIAEIEAGASGDEEAPAIRGTRGTEAGSDGDGPTAFKKLVSLVNVSDRSERGIRERLAKAGFDEAEIDDAVERAKGYGFIDDMRFAEVLIRSRISQGKGSAGIARELAENGIEAEDVPGWPYEFVPSEEWEVNRALELLDRKPPRCKNAREGAYRRLVQKGYPVSVASSAARTWFESVK